MNEETSEKKSINFRNILASQKYSAGSHSLIWDGTGGKGNAVASRIYYYQMIAGSFDVTGKMILMK